MPVKLTPTRKSMKAAKKVAAAKAKADAKKPAPKPVANPLAAFFERWKAGEQLATLAHEANVKRSKFRRGLIQLAGGKPAFKALRAAGAGGVTEPFGGKRATGGRTKEVIALDDSKARHVSASEREHWTHEHKPGVSAYYVVMIAPDGKRYVKAGPTERADVVFDLDVPGIPPARYKLETEASLAKKEKQEQKLIEKGEQALKATRAKKRAAKAARKAKSKKEAK